MDKMFWKSACCDDMWTWGARNAAKFVASAAAKRPTPRLPTRDQSNITVTCAVPLIHTSVSAAYWANLRFFSSK